MGSESGIDAMDLNGWTALVEECRFTAAQSKHCTRAAFDRIFLGVDTMGKMENKAAEADAKAAQSASRRRPDKDTLKPEYEWFRPARAATSGESVSPELSAAAKGPAVRAPIKKGRVAIMDRVPTKGKTKVREQQHMMSRVEVRAPV